MKWIVKCLFINVLSTILLSCEKENPTEKIDGVLYRVYFEGTWNSTSHPTDYPTNPHFSPLIGLTHNNLTSLFNLDSTASLGLKNMAETGGTSPLDDEINGIINAGNGLDQILGSGITGTGKMNTPLVVTEDFPLVSLVTMIAPSPDWFIGIQNCSLWNGQSFVDSVVVNAISYDAGTDTGRTFTSPNAPINPFEKIQLINSPPLGANAVLGKFTFVRQ